MPFLGQLEGDTVPLPSLSIRGGPSHQATRGKGTSMLVDESSNQLAFCGKKRRLTNLGLFPTLRFWRNWQKNRERKRKTCSSPNSSESLPLPMLWQLSCSPGPGLLSVLPLRVAVHLRHARQHEEAIGIMPLFRIQGVLGGGGWRKYMKYTPWGTKKMESSKTKLMGFDVGS